MLFYALYQYSLHKDTSNSNHGCLLVEDLTKDPQEQLLFPTSVVGLHHIQQGYAVEQHLRLYS